MSSESALRTAGDILALAKKRVPEAEVRVSVWDGWDANSRFARNEPTTNGDVQEVQVEVTVAIGKRHASAETNQTDELSIAGAIDHASRMARLSPEDSEWLPLLGKQEIAASPGAFDPEVATWDATKRAAAIGAAVAGARAQGVVGAGFLECGAHAWALMNSQGWSGVHQKTSVDLTMTARTPDGTGSGWAAQSTHRAADIDAGALGRRLRQGGPIRQAASAGSR